MVFPVIKLGYLVVKQVSKPLANALKRKAKTSPWLKNYILVPPAQLYHRWETIYKLKILGFAMGKKTNVKPMTEDEAIELSADILGELVIFAMAALTVVAEYRRQSKKEQAREQQQFQRLEQLESSLRAINSTLEAQNQQLEELRRWKDESSQSLPQRLLGGSSKRQETIKDAKTGTVLVVSS